MKLSTTLCLALVIALCYFVSVDSSPIQKDEIAKTKTAVSGRQSGPVVDPPIAGDDDDDDGECVEKICSWFLERALRKSETY